MASVFGDVKSLITGRVKLGLSGYYNKEIVTIDIDLVDSFVATHNTTISSHPIEKNPTKDNFTNITDHVNTSSPSVRLVCYIADNLNIAKSVTSLSNKAITAKEKLKIILNWQATGTILEMNGYGTGSEAPKYLRKLVNVLDSGWGALLDSDLDDPYYLGVDTDLIPHLVMGNLSVTRKADLGRDMELGFDLQRVKFAVSKNYSKGQSPSGNSSTNTKPAQTVEPKPVDVKTNKVSSKSVDVFKKKGATQ